MSRATLTRTQRAVAKALRGKTIARVIMNPFHPGTPDAETATDPTIVFTDGSRLAFVTTETETGDYGTELVYSRVKPE